MFHWKKNIGRILSKSGGSLIPRNDKMYIALLLLFIVGIFSEGRN